MNPPNLLLVCAEQTDKLDAATLKIADFGLARMLAAQTHDHAGLGLGYASLGR